MLPRSVVGEGHPALVRMLAPLKGAAPEPHAELGRALAKLIPAQRLCLVPSLYLVPVHMPSTARLCLQSCFALLGVLGTAENRFVV